MSWLPNSWNIELRSQSCFFSLGREVRPKHPGRNELQLGSCDSEISSTWLICIVLV